MEISTEHGEESESRAVIIIISSKEKMTGQKPICLISGDTAVETLPEGMPKYDLDDIAVERSYLK